MRVLVCDPISERGIDLLQASGDVVVDIRLKLPEEEIIKLVPDYEAIIVRSETRVTKRIIEAGVRLKVIGRAGVGVDNIDVGAATLQGIVVVNAPEGNTIAAAELAMGHMLALARRLPAANASLKSGLWERKKFIGTELKNKILGILGLGKIGTEVAKRAGAFGMRVYAYDPYVSEERAKGLGVEMKDLETLLREADFITVHLPKTKDSYHMIGAAQFALMKDGVSIINCARGGLIDEDALVAALEGGKVAGVALDVFETEPVTASPLFNFDQVQVTPHLGASTKEAQVNVAVDVSQEVLRALRGELVQTAVNIPAVKPELMGVFTPFLDLVERMGRYFGQVIDSPIHKVTITYSGDLAQYNLNPLTTTFLKGLLRPTLHDSVNYVNASIVAKSRGIKVMESKTADFEDYANLICVTVETAKGTKKMAGTILRKNRPRIVRIDDFDVDMPPIGHLIVMPHTDRPRIIGPTGTIIGDYNVNISDMHLARTTIGGPAMVILNIDGMVPDAALKRLGEIEGVHDVKYVNLSKNNC
ncbi:MAG: phosphoglycerate dehydrogenase [Heliobacteriaceae bacterium]|nr:phosphoglycerate dehydrogenase [Heliobacteriaceae bacterium]MDD4587704.1 phosphoglycerate dehydrogenase [Heliobacteriaceae bacterium]